MKHKKETGLIEISLPSFMKPNIASTYQKS